MIRNLVYAALVVVVLYGLLDVWHRATNRSQQLEGAAAGAPIPGLRPEDKLLWRRPAAEDPGRVAAVIRSKEAEKRFKERWRRRIHGAAEARPVEQVKQRGVHVAGTALALKDLLANPRLNDPAWLAEVCTQLNGLAPEIERELLAAEPMVGAVLLACRSLPEAVPAQSKQR